MKLLMAIVSDRDAGRVVDELVSLRIGVTRINTHGGFLKRGNATLLIGVDDDAVDGVIRLIEENCEVPSKENGVKHGAGTVFVLGVKQFARV